MTSVTATMIFDSMDELLRRLGDIHPSAGCQLRYETPFQLLVAAILMAQSSAGDVNHVTQVLFERYPTPQLMAEAERPILEKLIRPTGFHRQKARYLQMTGQIIVDEYDGKVPRDIIELCRLPGVARKTANIVLGELDQQPTGPVIDTHVKRVARRLGLSTAKSPESVERELMMVLPQAQWLEISYLLSAHGRRICHPRQPGCDRCLLRDICATGSRQSSEW